MTDFLSLSEITDWEGQALPQVVGPRWCKGLVDEVIFFIQPEL